MISKKFTYNFRLTFLPQGEDSYPANCEKEKSKNNENLKTEVLLNVNYCIYNFN